MKQKFNAFLARKTTVDALLTGCMCTFLGTIVLLFLWVLLLVGGWSNFVNTVKFSQILAIVDRVYIGEGDTQAVSDAGFAAMIDSLGDRWSYYMNAEDYDRYLQVQANRYTGIGITLTRREEGLRILSVAEDSPAARAGITGDTWLVAVNGQRLTDESSNEVAQMLAQDPEHITVVIADDAGVETEYTLAMEVIYSNPVNSQMLEGSIGYVQLENFDETSAQQAITAVESLMEQGAQGLIFDVRNNGGGYVTELTDLLDYLLPEGEIFVFVDESGKETITRSDARCIDLPMAVLVNEHSYSAAEFFAAALGEYDAATLVGAPTTGKNRSQTNMILVDGSAVHISSKRYLTPDRIDLTQQGGLTPDLVVEAGEEDTQLAAALGIFP